jgi:flagellar hook assembly protein FlgD
MAQFSTLSAMQELSAGFTDFLSVSYIGKNVTATQTASGGSTQTIKGTVEKVEYLSGETYLTVNGTRISPNEITEISA